MAQEKLPRELVEEEILTRVPPLSLCRFKTVCKRWNALFNDQRFINNQLARARPQFILAAKSKYCSISINLDDDNNPKIEEHELTLDIPAYTKSKIPITSHHCDGLLLCTWNKKAAVFNPWFRQTRLVEPDLKQTSTQFEGIGYENRRPGDSNYKILASQLLNKSVWKVYNFASNAWKDYDFLSNGGSIQEESSCISLFNTSVSLNGTLYWVASYEKYHDYKLFIISYDFSRKRFKAFCDLPCVSNYLEDPPVLAVFEGDRFSVLKQCTETKKIEIWVTKNKINTLDGEDKVWLKFMEVSSTNLPKLVQTGSYSQPSYFIRGNRLVVCSCDETGRAWIYIFGGNRLLSKIQIDSIVDHWPSHCTYIPSLAPVPLIQREEL